MKRTRIIMLAAVMTLVASVATVACGGDTVPGRNSSSDISNTGPAMPPVSDSSAQSGTADLPNRVGGATESKGVAPVAGATPAANAYSTAGGGANDTTQGAAADQLDRKIIFNAKLDIASDDVHAAFAEASRVARNAGGFVDKSSVYAKKDDSGIERTYATLTVRVPVGAYQDVLQSLRTLPGGKVTKEESGSREVTDQYTDLQSRLRNLQRSESQYLTLLGQAKTIQEIMTVNDRIDSIRLQIERIQGQMNMLDNLSDLATIDVTMAPPPPAKAQPKDEGPQSPKVAFLDAWGWTLEAGQYAIAAGAAAAAVAIWLAVPAGLALAGARLARRRRTGAAA